MSYDPAKLIARSRISDFFPFLENEGGNAQKKFWVKSCQRLLFKSGADAKNKICWSKIRSLQAELWACKVRTIARSYILLVLWICNKIWKRGTCGQYLDTSTSVSHIRTCRWTAWSTPWPRWWWWGTRCNSGCWWTWWTSSRSTSWTWWWSCSNLTVSQIRVRRAQVRELPRLYTAVLSVVGAVVVTTA